MLHDRPLERHLRHPHHLRHLWLQAPDSPGTYPTNVPQRLSDSVPRQGADILAHADDEHHQYQVYIPDIFLGKPMPLDAFPPDTDEKSKALGEFFSGPAAPPKTVANVPKWVDEITARSNGTIKKWGILGACWGGKIVSLCSAEGTKFSSAAEVHPAMVDPADAKKVTIPLCMLASGDEEKKDVEAFEKELNVKKHVETFGDQVHVSL